MTREDYLKGLIIKRYGSIRKFAEYTGIASSTITSMLSKGVGGTSVDTVIKICKALGITVEELQNIESKDNIKKESNKPITIAAHLPEGVELTEEEMKQVNDFVQFIISKRDNQKWGDIPCYTKNFLSRLITKG